MIVGFDETARTVDQVAPVDDAVVFGAGFGEELAEFELVLAVGDRAEFGALIQGRADVQRAQALGSLPMTASICERCTKKRSAAAQICRSAKSPLR